MNGKADQMDTSEKLNKVAPNLWDYHEACAAFRWEQVYQEMAGLRHYQRGLNIAHEAVGRHASSETVAIRWLGKQGQVYDFTYQSLNRLSNRFANVLQGLKIGKEDRVFLLTGRIPKLYIAALGTWKNTSVFCPLFSAFAPEIIHQDLIRGDAKILVTTSDLYHKKLERVMDRLPGLQYVIVVDADKHLNKKVLSWDQLMQEASDHFDIPHTDPEDVAILHFTSGTTGMPKGTLHTHKSVLMHYVTGKYVLDLHPKDIYWCTADPSWITGTSYGMIAPLTHGVTSIIDEADFIAERWYQILEEQQINVWYTSPTAVRMLMRSASRPQKTLKHLRLILSVGETLNRETIAWARKTLGMPIYDHWCQTETGGIIVANFPALEIKPGSMGHPVPGIEVAVLSQTEEGHITFLPPNHTGNLAIKKSWPSMFRGYLLDEKKYRNSFVEDWYITGDLARQDEDGYFWFVGRADDLIKT